MLQSFRDTIMGWVGYAIVALIILVFALWGISSYLGGGTSPPVVDIDGVEISEIEFQNALQQAQQRYRQIYGTSLPSSHYESDEFKQEVLQGLVRNSVVRQAADKRGFGVSDAMLVDRIQSLPAFQDNGVFSRERYQQALASQGRSVAGFEEALREDLRRDQVVESISGTSFVPRTAMLEYDRLAGQTRTIRYFRIDKNSLRDQVAVSDADIEAYYEANRAGMMSPERARVNYVLLSETDLMADVVIDEAQLRGLYDRDPGRYVSDESRIARTILVALEAGASPESRSAAEQRARALYEQLNNGADFAQVAAENSDDEATAENGGLMGEVFQGDVHVAVEQAIFSTSEGDIAEPVLSSRGYEIIRVDEVRIGAEQPFEQARSKVEEDYRRDEASYRFAEISSELVNLAYEEESLEVVAERVGLELQTSDWIQRNGGPGIGQDPEVVDVIFSGLVYEQNRNSDVIDLVDGSQLVVHLAERESPQQLTLEQVKEDIRAVLQEQALRDLTREHAVALVNRIAAGEAVEAVVEEFSYQLETAENIDRRANAPDRAIVRHAFRQPSRGSETSNVSSVVLANGDAAVVLLDQVSENANADTVSSATLQGLSSNYGLREASAWLSALEEAADVHYSDLAPNQ